MGDDAQAIRELKSLGPKSEAMLARAGIASVGRLRELGAVAAYARVRDAGGRVSLNLLWALESALTGEAWQTIARRQRTSLLLALDALDAGAAKPRGNVNRNAPRQARTKPPAKASGSGS